MLATKSFSKFLGLGDELIFGQAGVFVDDTIYSCLRIDMNFEAWGFLHLLPESFGDCTLAHSSTFVFYVNGLKGLKLQVIDSDEVFEHFVSRLGWHSNAAEGAAFVVGSFF